MAEPTNPYHRLIEKAFSDAIPLNCQIEITYRCNHLCSFCYNSPTGQREMSTEEIFTALGKISDSEGVWQPDYDKPMSETEFSHAKAR